MTTHYAILYRKTFPISGGTFALMDDVTYTTEFDAIREAANTSDLKMVALSLISIDLTTGETKQIYNSVQLSDMIHDFNKMKGT